MCGINEKGGRYALLIVTKHVVTKQNRVHLEIALIQYVSLWIWSKKLFNNT